LAGIDSDHRGADATVTKRLRVLVVGRPYDLSDTEYDGLVLRQRMLVSALLGAHDVSIQTLRPYGDTHTLAPSLRRFVCSELTVERPRPGRTGRVGHLVRLAVHRDHTPWTHSVLAGARSAAPHVVVTLGPWLDDEYAILFRNFRSVHLFEEDVRRMPEIASQSPQGRALCALETWVRKATLPQPSVAIAISAAELPAVRRRFPKARAEVLPLTLPAGKWPLAASASSGDILLVVGALTEPRNAEGLREVLAELAVSRPPGLRVRLASGSGLHTMLEPYLALPWVITAAPPADLRPLYRSARLALVPAKRATGIKTTILQAWSAGCPVVTYAGSAATLRPHSDALLSAGDARDLADLVRRAWSGTELRAELAARGRSVIAEHFDGARHVGRFLAVVAETARA
jgi:glycosyltransferase involved in cell wall biosynthesis